MYLDITEEIDEIATKVDNILHFSKSFITPIAMGRNSQINGMAR